jgi:ribosomal protein S18 acetylase RimI-like enzyme
MEVRVREATPADVPGLARVDTDSKVAAYAHILPASFNFKDSEQRIRWQRIVEQDPAMKGGAAEVVLVALRDDEVVGYIGLLHSTDEDGEGIGEVGTLYVAPEYWRRGIGSSLLAAGTAHLGEMGFKEAGLWVLERNIQARSFYEKECWKYDGTRRTVPLQGTPVVQLRYRKAFPREGG